MARSSVFQVNDLMVNFSAEKNEAIGNQQATSNKQQVTSNKQPATSNQQQASSNFFGRT